MLGGVAHPPPLMMFPIPRGSTNYKKLSYESALRGRITKPHYENNFRA